MRHILAFSEAANIKDEATFRNAQRSLRGSVGVQYGDEQCLVVGVDDASKPGTTFSAFKGVAFKSASVDAGSSVSTEQ